jgi:signal transduction histidine kinase
VATPVRDEVGAVKQVMVVSRDVSELVLAREALKDADRRKDDFLTLVAHELRNPISAGNTICELLKLKPLEHARTAELAARIQRQFLHMSRVAEDLLDVSRIRRGEIHLDLRPLDAALVVHEALDQLQPAIAARRHQVALDLPEHPCLVDGDHFRLVQVVGNLLGNAVRYTGEGGAIRLELAQHDGVVQLSVADNGVGMAPDCIAGIFDLYAQLDSSDGRRHHGLGLGLPLVRAIVALHGGTVTASSPGEGLGSVFVVALPAARQAAP